MSVNSIFMFLFLASSAAEYLDQTTLPRRLAKQVQDYRKSVGSGSGGPVSSMSISSA
jgi:hypothetical protein